MHLCSYVCICVSKCVRIYMDMHTCLCVCIACVHGGYIYRSMCINIGFPMSKCLCICMCEYMYMNVYVYS